MLNALDRVQHMLRPEHLERLVRTSAKVGGVLLYLLAAAYFGYTTLLYAILILLGLFSLKFPEIAFVLFLNAGMYKGDPRLELPNFLDLTVYFGLVCILAMIVNLILRRIKFSLPPNRLLIPYLGMAVMATVGMTYTPGPLYGEDKLLRFLTLTTFALFGPWFLLQSEKSIRRFLVLFAVLSSAMSVDVLFEFRFLPGRQSGFGSAFGSSYLGLGSVAGEGVLILAFYLLPVALSRLRKALVVAAIGLGVFGVFVAGAKSPPLALACTVLAVAIFYSAKVAARQFHRRRIPRPHVVLLRELGALAGLIGLIVIEFHEYLLTFFVRSSDFLADPTDTQWDRVEFYHQALDSILRFPSGLIGLGFGGFGKHYYGFDAPRGYFPHNLLLEVGSELGIIGLVCFVLMLYWAFAGVIRNLNAQLEKRYFLGVTLIILLFYMNVYFSFHGDINDARVIFTWVGCSFAFVRWVSSERAKSV
jgi:O-antigen ligase